MTNLPPFPDFLPYWRNESTGKLSKAVHRYFGFATGDDPNELTNSEIALLRAYLKFWIDYAWQGLDDEKLFSLRVDFYQATTYKQLRNCIDVALELGIDPF